MPVLADHASKGPTVIIDDVTTDNANKIDKFMYFVPLVSPVSVECKISETNSQLVKILSCDVIKDQRKFRATCEFQISGKGRYITQFKPEAIVKNILLDKPNRKVLTNLIDYIEIDGNGFGRFEIKGRIINGRKVVNEVRVNFKSRKLRSPVVVELYSLKANRNQFDYKKRYDVTVARINALVFKKTKGIPRMEIVLDSVNNGNVSDSFWAAAKGFIANFFIKPVEVDAVGNQSVLDFCQAIVHNKESFTFPKASNLKGLTDI